jgi:small conductance mechanosensitive channel
METTAIGNLYHWLAGQQSTAGKRLLLIIGLVALAHLLVTITRAISEKLMAGDNSKNPIGYVTKRPKFITISKLAAGAFTGCFYFLAVGLILQELGVNLTGYLASASIIALAISFGSQGLVQDIVIGLTLIFSDALEVGTMVEVFASTTVIGVVEEVGLRFTKLRTYAGQILFIPNRTIANVSKFPQKGVLVTVDVQLPAESKLIDNKAVLQKIKEITDSFYLQFSNIVLEEPTVQPIQSTGQWEYLSVDCKVWPGHTDLLEQVYKPMLLSFLQRKQPDYAPWQVTCTLRKAGSHKSLK